MAKPILNNPIIRGKQVKEFSKLFLCKTIPSPGRVKQNEKDIKVFLSAKLR